MIGMVITGVTLLTAGIIALYKNWDKVWPVIKAGFEYIGKAVMWVVDLFKGVLPVLKTLFIDPMIS